MILILWFCYYILDFLFLDIFSWIFFFLRETALIAVLKMRLYHDVMYGVHSALQEAMAGCSWCDFRY